MKTKTVLLVLLALVVAKIQAQKIPVIKVKDNNLGITSLQMDVQIIGNTATTTYDMLFYNPSDKILEGELAFPLGEGQSVVRLALDINGKLRESVIVEKEQGRIAFEAVVRKRVDPVLLEKVTGNNYKARIYPIPARGYKRIVLAYEQNLKRTKNSNTLQFPLEFTQTLDSFKMQVEILSTAKKASITSHITGFDFSKHMTKQVATISKQNYKPNDIIEISIPLNTEEAAVINDKTYFYINQIIQVKNKFRTKPKSISILWDASLSMQKRDLDKELDLIDSYIKHLNNVSINLLVFRNKLSTTKHFIIKNGEWNTLKKQLENTKYDGGTSFAFIENYLIEELDTSLFFTDAMNNLDDTFPKFKKPVFVINSLLVSNHVKAKTFTNESTGAYINLKNQTVEESFNKLTKEKYSLLSINTDNKETEIFQKAPQTINQVLNLYGKNYKEGQKIRLSFGYSGIESEKIEITLSKKEETLPKLGILWGKNKINFLQKKGDVNKNEIISLSKEFNIISNYTSMIVLDDVRDYIRYNIDPPADLMEAYNRLKGEKAVRAVSSSDEENREISENGSFTISGIVSDETGALPGVSVQIKGGSTGTETDFDGKYTLPVNRGDILQFSYVGMNSYEIEATSSKANLMMSPSSENMLDEVVVTALGVKREKKALGYAVTTVKTEEIHFSGNDVAQALAGKVAGVEVTQASGLAGSVSSIRIRGASSINGNNQPLYVIDGMPFAPENNEMGIDFLDEDDIKSIKVIKGIRGTTLYGSRARNGVIVIETHQGDTSHSVSQSRYEPRPEPVARNKYKGLLELTKPNKNIPYIISYNNLKTEEEFYTHYLKQRDNNLEHPAYFIDVYDLFISKGFHELAEQIISNIVEIDTDNYELLKVYAYKMEVSKQEEKATFIYKKILELRPEDAQSYRDLALIYQKTGEFDKSIKLLDSIVSKKLYKGNQRRNFVGLNAIALIELKNMQTTKKSQNKKNTFDIRVLIDWNHNDTDIDLHVIDPNREECNYKNTKTRIGGHISRDMTQGFGPEEFTLKNAIKGNYYIKVHYYSDRYQKVENPTFLKVTIYKNYGKPNETVEQQIIRLDRHRKDMIISKLVF